MPQGPIPERFQPLLESTMLGQVCDEPSGDGCKGWCGQT